MATKPPKPSPPKPRPPGIPGKKNRTADPQPAPPFPIVGIGASAGGLEALQEFFAHLPAAPGMAFVVIVHQHPGHISLLPALLGHQTPLPVVVAEDGMHVAPDHIYISPPSENLALLKGTLHRMERAEHAKPPLPIDYFFRSLGRDQKDQAVGIVLSGTGSDGALGLKEIKGEGGMVMAQDPLSAKYAGMPRSAIATGLVDYALPAAKLPEQLLAYVQGSRPKPALAPTAPVEVQADEWLSRILVLLRDRTGNDFSNYKISTVQRRIQRRMNVHQIDDARTYARFLQENPAELDVLFHELLIGVTNFFRDPEAFAALSNVALPRLLAARPEGHTLRVWVAGCSTGEEAYSIAILLRESMERAQRRFGVQMYATDLDGRAIESARGGLYPEGIAIDVPPERLARFFTRTDTGYRINKDIREMVIFARHNIISDPPFTKLDLLSCRNLLIYLDAELQHRLLRQFGYSLRPDGLLVLGSSESTGDCRGLFHDIDKKWKIFARNKVLDSTHEVVTAWPRFLLGKRAAALGDGRAGLARPLGIPELTKDLLIDLYVPPSILVNGHGEVVFIHGRTGEFLEPAPGQANHSLFDMAREGLRVDLAAALRRAAQAEDPVVLPQLKIEGLGGARLVTLTVRKIAEPPSLHGLFLISFQSAGPAPADAPAAGRPSRRQADRMKVLERELHHACETLQCTVEEAETTNEELRSTNEELQSTNEELQSASEELETSKEEMQSLNEELQTLNAELHSKIDDLSHANDDMANLLNSTSIATIFLDSRLRIKRYTNPAQRVVNLLPSDIGRPLTDLVTRLKYTRLSQDAAEVLRTLNAKEVEVRSSEGEWYLARLVPYLTAESRVEGLVLTFVDISRLKAIEEIEHARDFAESIVQTVRQPLLVLDGSMHVLLANQAFCRRFMVSSEDVQSRALYEISDRQWDVPALRDLLARIVLGDGGPHELRFTHDFQGIGQLALVVSARRLQRKPKLPVLVLLAIEETPAEGPHEPSR